MPEALRAAPHTRLVARLRERLDDLGLSLRVVAEGLLGADAPIDLVSLDADGRVVLVLVAEQDDLALVTLALAQCAWVEARLGDWAQLAPDLGIDPRARVRAVLLAPDFSSQAVAAVRSAAPETLDLARYHVPAGGGPVCLEPCWQGNAPRRARSRARFRTGLPEAELALHPDERRALA